MSGGSYEYLFCKSAPELLTAQEMVQRMADRLAGLGYAHDAAKETYTLLLTLRQFEVYVDTISTRLQGVWRGIEWWDSGDSSEERIHDDLARYRESFVPGVFVTG